MPASKSIRQNTLISLGAGAVLGAVISWLSPAGAFPQGWLAAGFLSALGFFCLMTAWKWAGGGRLLFWTISVAFLLRLVVGVGATLLLPEYGFDDPTQNAGYLFNDAFQRDVEAYDITKSDSSFWQIFTMEFDTDQYGGLLVLSGLVYKFLSPDAHRTLLILLMSAFAAALGIPFLWKGVTQRWGEATAKPAVWILAFYPDYILFSSSQMREPYLVTLACIALWGVVQWRHSWKRALPVILAALTGMAVFSSKAVAIVAVLVAVWFWMEYLAPRSRCFRWLGYLGLGGVGLAVMVYSWKWLRSSAWYDLRLTILNSGRIQYELAALKEWLRTPFLIGYGLLQPVLPAILAYPTLAIWKWIGILRALGWYLLAPSLLYGFFISWKEQPRQERRILVWFSLVIAVWLVVSSARGGGDQWDNPRYRLLLLPWMAILAVRSIQWARQRRDAWLYRLLLVELIFVAFFTHWYISRYLKWWNRMAFQDMIIWITGLSLVVIIGGLIWDSLRKRRRQKAGPDRNL